MNRRRFLISFGSTTLALLASACGTSNTQAPIELARDKPTLLYFFTDN